MRADVAAPAPRAPAELALLTPSLAFFIRLDNKMIQAIAKEYKFNNCDITFRQDCTVDELIDVIEGNMSTQKNRRHWRCG